MRQELKMEYLKKIYSRYHSSTKADKNKILDEFCEVCNYNRKYAIRKINGRHPRDPAIKRKPKEYKYLKQTITALELIWEAAGYPWSSRLKSMIPLWLPWAKKHYTIYPEVEQQLLKISSATIDRRLKDKKDNIRKRIYTTTKPGYLLKHQIPIRTGLWDVKIPGFMEIDLVAHCGTTTEGNFINSLNCVDIHTTWTETRAIMGRGQRPALAAMEEIRNSLPFELKGIDPDNDYVFINQHIKNFCDKNKIQFTRSRPYKKDDNAHIEQKNWTHVRKIFGYLRYDSEPALKAMNDLYCNELRWFQNFFQPSVKLIEKVRVGSRLKRVYDGPRTPFERLCECSSNNDPKIIELKQTFEKLDPFQLSKTIDKKIQAIHNMGTTKIKTKRTFEERIYADLKQDLAYARYTNL